MPSTKKRARSPEIDGPLSTRQSTSVQIHQNAPSKRRYRGPKYDRIKALQKLERKRRAVTFQDTSYNPVIARAHPLNTSVCHTAPAPVESPLQSSPGPDSPPSLPAEGDEGGPEGFNDSPVSHHVPLGPGLRTASGFGTIALFSIKPATSTTTPQHGINVVTTKLHNGNRPLFHDSYPSTLQTARRRNLGDYRHYRCQIANVSAAR